ncbi:hypothetical protein [Campylobacter sp.]|uniref:hypothetical protein n=1 Tax=Campylobacter sp. TaxID=205 RepID=UPI0026DD8CC7|nr:hypothetical protein [Campylobacter sp.]MDO4674207.1 hypothetical protein [Campylobacter sp.]
MKDFDLDDEKAVFAALNRLINGMSCEIRPKPQQVPQDGLIYASNGQAINAFTEQSRRRISFEGRILHGGILQEDGSYLSDDGEFIYTLDTSRVSILSVRSVCEKNAFQIVNFSKQDLDFGLHLCEKPYKELGFIHCNTLSIKPYFKALQEIAPFIARRIFKGPEFFTKAIINDFKSKSGDILGAFYEAQSFTKAIQALPQNPQMLYLLNKAMIETMRHFTKHNGLAKELYIFATNPTPPDAFRAEAMLKMMKNLNANIIQGRPELAINQVVCHCFALGEDVEFLQNLSRDSGGKYHRTDTPLAFKRALLSQLDGGRMPDASELGKDAEIEIITPHKMPDDDPPQI